MGSLRLPPAILSISLYALASAPAALAQDAAPPAHVAFVDGVATLEREGQTQQAVAGAAFIPGDRLRTATGRVEVLFPDGSALDIDEYASVDLQAETLLRLAAGRIMLIVAGANDPAAALRYQIDTPVATAFTDGPGEYRVALLSGPGGQETELAVFRGSGALQTESGSTLVRAGERSLARDFAAPSYSLPFNSARFDAFDRWSAARRDARMGTAASARYLPRDLSMYGGALDRHGAWGYEPPYGYVWYPAVAPGWRPYYMGYWSSVRSFGWMWVGFDAWSWPTHHYGRWGFARSRWYWVPDRHWAPAWVSWAAAPGFISWCPLGFDNRPVFALSLTAGNPWDGWVVLPRTHFGGRRHVNRHAVDGHHLPATTPFIVQATAPIAAPPAAARPRSAASGVAVPRRAASDNRAVPRTGSQWSVVSPGAPAPDPQSRASAVEGRAMPTRPATPRADIRSGVRRSPDEGRRMAPPVVNPSGDMTSRPPARQQWRRTAPTLVPEGRSAPAEPSMAPQTVPRVGAPGEPSMRPAPPSAPERPPARPAATPRTQPAPRSAPSAAAPQRPPSPSRAAPPASAPQGASGGAPRSAPPNRQAAPSGAGAPEGRASRR